MQVTVQYGENRVLSHLLFQGLALQDTVWSVNTGSCVSDRRSGAHAEFHAEVVER